MLDISKIADEADSISNNSPLNKFLLSKKMKIAHNMTISHHLHLILH